MSGGYFDYDQFRIANTTSTIEEAIRNEKDPEFDGYKQGLSEHTLAVFDIALTYLNISEIYAQRIDWLLSGDDGEETFHKRLLEDLSKLEEI